MIARRMTYRQAKKADDKLRALAGRLGYSENLKLSINNYADGFDRVRHWCGGDYGKTKHYRLAIDAVEDIDTRLEAFDDDLSRLEHFSPDEADSLRTKLRRAQRAIRRLDELLIWADEVTQPIVFAGAQRAAGIRQRDRARVRIELARPRRDVLPIEAKSPSVRAARRLLDLAVLLLPPARRSRYSEEFSAEFRQLSAGRVGFALRLVLHSLALRRVLAEQAPEPEGE
ncbi:hypothetical protein [Amycolatopsis vancoresmycina]|uniref:hypothetical protein n=1 Tax=Amycolatopsis vancoresmycina TaxID=208444 RepID=UPI0012DF10BF|nr:hypothetical protein [Amycolatopsis vancoresmycina]